METKNISEIIKEAGATEENTDMKTFLYKNHYKNVHLVIRAINYLMAQDYLLDDTRYPADWFLIKVEE